MKFFNFNLGTLDKIFRLIIALAIILLASSGKLSETIAIVLEVIAAVLILTTALSYCPIYALFGISTK